MKLEPLKAYRATSGNTDGSINTGNVIWLSEDGSLNVMGEGVNGFYTPDELTPEILDFEAVLCDVYRVVKNGNDELLIMREATPEERESIREYIDNISERVVSISRVKKYLEEIEEEFAELLNSLKESHDWGRVYGVEMVLDILKDRITVLEQEI